MYACMRIYVYMYINFVFVGFSFSRATTPEVHYTVYEWQLSAADHDHGNLLKANQVRLVLYLVYTAAVKSGFMCSPPLGQTRPALSW